MAEHRSAYLPADASLGAPGIGGFRDSVYDGARVKGLPFLFTGDAAQNDTVLLCPVPSWGVACPQLTSYFTTAFGADVTLDVGFKADAAIGYLGDPDALVDGADVSGALGQTSMMSNVAKTDLFKRWWQIAGLTRDPRTNLWVVATFLSANPASGTLIGSVGTYRD